MEFIPVLNTAKIEFVYSVDGQECVNTFHVEKATAFGSEEMSDLAVVAKDAWQDNLAGQHNNDVSLGLVRATDLTTQNAPGYELGIVPMIPGQGSGELCPLNVSLVFKFTTGYRGRSYRGRWFWVGIDITHVAANRIDQTWGEDTVTAFGEFIADFITAGYTPVVVSRIQNGQPLLFGITTPIDGVRTDGIVDSQRRRLPGRGR